MEGTGHSDNVSLSLYQLSWVALCLSIGERLDVQFDSTGLINELKRLIMEETKLTWFLVSEYVGTNINQPPFGSPGIRVNISVIQHLALCQAWSQGFLLLLYNSSNNSTGELSHAWTSPWEKNSEYDTMNVTFTFSNLHLIPPSIQTLLQKCSLLL